VGGARKTLEKIQGCNRNIKIKPYRNLFSLFFFLKDGR
jgi:hypothetical protein